MEKVFTMVLLIAGLISGSLLSQIPQSAYVANSLGQNLSMINLENGSVIPDVLPLGLYTNFIKVEGQKAYVVNSGVNNIQVIDLAGLTTEGFIDLGSGTNPWAIDFINDSLAAVSLLFTNEVAIVNVNSRQVVQNISVGSGPEGIRFYNGRIYVANSAYNGAGYDPGTVSVIDVNTFTVVNTLSVGINPQDLDVDSQGNLIVACSGDYVSINSQIDFIDLSSGAVWNTITLPLTMQATSLRISSQDKCYIGTFGFGVMVYDVASQSFERDDSNPLQGGPGIVFDAQNNAYIADFFSDSVFVFSPVHQQIAAYQVGDGPVSIDLYIPETTGIDEDKISKAADFTLFQNYPNPFNPATNIQYTLARRQYVILQIYNVLGEEVATLVNGFEAPGTYTVRWNAVNKNGLPVPGGIYFYRLKSDSRVE
ncbi:MAG: hypothetical protein ACE5GL_07850, partial [Calditrichia bacterium]